MISGTWIKAYVEIEVHTPNFSSWYLLHDISENKHWLTEIPKLLQSIHKAVYHL
jgi:hypothetical protein